VPRVYVHLAGFVACFVSFAYADAPRLSVKSTVPLSAFTPDHLPDIELTLEGRSEWHGFIRIERFDLLSEKTTIDYVPANVAAGRLTQAKYASTVPFGIYRLECAPVTNHTDLPAEETVVRTTFAYAPARNPHQLPDDWPLGAHVTFDDPPLPGFKWYRYFSSWAEDNPAKNQFDWSRLDTVSSRVRAIGGRLLIANDTTPSWTALARPVTRPWVKSATAFPPDDMNDLRVYLDTMLQRFDKAGTIGALEVWNEANTPERWMGTPEQMVEMARIFREAAAASQKRVQRAAPARIVGIAVSSGDAQDYVRGLVRAGILPYLDVVSGHWYEEMLSYDRATPINSLPLHVDLLTKPMHAAGFSLPIWNSESGIASAPREDGKIIAQDELNRRAMALPGFDPKRPWLAAGDRWREVSERRAAASFVAGTAMLMSLGVEKTFVYSMRDEGWILDGAPSLSWVALAEFGAQLFPLDYHTIVPVMAKMENGDPAIRALAFRFGAADKPGVIVAWTYAQDTTVGRPKLWQPWLAPQSVRIDITAPSVEVGDLYGRTKTRVPATNNSVVIPIGEEPVYVREVL
jgi:hypothetical protein